MDRFQLSCLGLFCLVFLILTCIKQFDNLKTGLLH